MRSLRSLASLFTLSIAALAASLTPACGGGAETTGMTTTSTTASTSTETTASSSSMGGAGGSGTTTTTTSSTSTASGSGGTGGTSCGRVLGPDDGPRKIVIGHPYDANGGPAPVWEVLDLSATGTLSKTGKTFQMGRAYAGEIVFTPDGKVGIVVQDDGSLGVMRFEDDGAVTVVHAKFEGSFYAGQVVMDPSGDGAFVLDPNWRNNGGGLYRISIGCDGTLTDLGQVAPAKLPYGMVRLRQVPSIAVLAATDVLDSTTGNNAHLLDVTTSTPALMAGAPAFPDNNAIVSSVALTHDDRFALIADYGEDSTPNRVAVLAVTDHALAKVQTISGGFIDPFALLTSPFGNAAIIVGGYDDAIFALGYDPNNAATPFTMNGEIAYVGKAPELPGSAVQIQRGTLKGRFYVSETSAVRQGRFETDGKVTDLGAFPFGTGLENIVGAIGITP